jgi:hypothetical protein
MWSPHRYDEAQPPTQRRQSLLFSHSGSGGPKRP